jgi:hypothetical protein
MAPPVREVAHQCRIELQVPLPSFEHTVSWAKADMLATACFDRPDLFRTARPRQRM